MTAMTVQNVSWQQVAKNFDAIGARLRKEVDEVTAAGDSDRAAVEKAVHSLLTALDDTLQVASRIARDPQLHKDVKALAVSVRDAAQASFGEVRGHVTTTVKRSHHAPASSAARKRTATKATAHRVPVAKSTSPTAGKAPARKATHR